MKAMLIKPGETEATLEIEDIASPELGVGEIRIAVHAASVNRADLLIRAGTHASTYTDPVKPAIAGLDAAGEILEVGLGVEKFRPGDRVMAMVGGGLAEEIVLPSSMAIPIPGKWSYEEGAAAVIGLMTEHNALVTAGRFAADESVLIHAVTSGVALQGVQLARYLGAGTIFGTCRTVRGAEVLKNHGVDVLIDTNGSDFVETILEQTKGHGADVILDHVGGPYLRKNLAAAAIGGRMVSVGRLGGSDGSLDLEELARKRFEIVGVTFRTRSLDEKAAVVSALVGDIDLDAGSDELRPLIHKTFDWTNALEAQSELAKNAHLGKIVLQVRS